MSEASIQAGTYIAQPPAQPLVDSMPTGMSREIDQISMALSIAMGQMFSPAKNRHVHFVTKKGDTVDYRYATLDAINDMIRGPLADNNLVLAHFTMPTKNGLFVRTRLLLGGTSQWLETVLPVTIIGEGPQAVMSGLTYTRRYTTCMLLNIAAEEDDDGSSAQGNAAEFPKHPGERERLMRDRYNKLMYLGNTAAHPAEVTEMLSIWQRDCDEWLGYRNQEAREEQWEVIFRLVPGAVGRVFGAKMGEAWRMATTAATTNDVDALRLLWTDAVDVRKAMKDAAPAGYGLLAEHVRLAAGRVLREQEEEEESRTVQIEQPAAKSAGAVEDPGAQEASDDEQPRFTDRPLFTPFDENGEIAGDVEPDAVSFAKAFAALAAVSDDYDSLYEQNSPALSMANRDPTARDIIASAYLGSKDATRVPGAYFDGGQMKRELDAQVAAMVRDTFMSVGPAPEQPALFPAATAPNVARPVAMPMTGRGSPNLAGYLLAVKQALQRVGPDMFEAWVEANEPIYNELPTGTRFQVMAVVQAARFGSGGGR